MTWINSSVSGLLRCDREIKVAERGKKEFPFAAERYRERERERERRGEGGWEEGRLRKKDNAATNELPKSVICKANTLINAGR